MRDGYPEAMKPGGAAEMYSAAVSLLDGDVTGRDPRRAFGLLALAAESDDPVSFQARYRMGLCLEKGDGTAADPGLAVYMFEKSALGGHHPAILRLGGRAAAGGFSVGFCPADPSDSLNAAKAYRIAAARGDAGAAYMMSVCCSRGLDTPKSEAEARFWLRVSHADVEAMNRLAERCESGDLAAAGGMPAAAVWYGRAAERGHTGAMYRYASLLASGTGAKADFHAAEAWMRRAAESGHERAKKELGLFEAILDPDISLGYPDEYREYESLKAKRTGERARASRLLISLILSSAAAALGFAGMKYGGDIRAVPLTPDGAILAAAALIYAALLFFAVSGLGGGAVRFIALTASLSCGALFCLGQYGYLLPAVPALFAVLSLALFARERIGISNAARLESYAGSVIAPLKAEEREKYLVKYKERYGVKPEL